MAKFFLVFAAICVFQVYGRASAPAEHDHVKELGEQIQTLAETVKTEIEKALHFTEPKEVKETTAAMQKYFNEFAEKGTEVLKGLQKEVHGHSGELTKTINTMTEKFNEQVKKIQSEHPKETAKVKEYQKEIETFYNDMAARTKAVADSIAKDTSGLQEHGTKLFEEFEGQLKGSLEHMGKELKKVIDEHQKSHHH